MLGPSIMLGWTPSNSWLIINYLTIWTGEEILGLRSAWKNEFSEVDIDSYLAPTFSIFQHRKTLKVLRLVYDIVRG